MVTIKRIDVKSAMKIGALLYALLFTVFGLFFLGLQMLLFSAISSSTSQQSFQNSQSFSSSAFLAGGLVAFCIGYITMVGFAAFSGAITGAVTAFLYNLISNWVGGLEIELGSVAPEKRKREVVVGESPTGF